MFRGLIHRHVAQKNAHYPIFILFSNVLCCNLESKKSGWKKSLNTFSLAANILKSIVFFFIGRASEGAKVVPVFIRFMTHAWKVMFSGIFWVF